MHLRTSDKETAGKMTLEEAQLIWNLLPHPTGTIVRMFARNRDTQALDGDFASNAGELAHFANVHIADQVYLCPNPATSTKGIRHTAADVSHWSYLLVDIDPIEEIFNADAALDAALICLGEWLGRDFFKQRPLIINSGRGRQIWVRLEDVELKNDDDRRIARRVNGYWLARLAERVGLCHGTNVDTSCSDLPRPMRCPFTFNQKTGQMARIIEPSGTVFRGLATLLTVGTPPEKLVDPPAPVLRKGLPWQLVQHCLTKTAKDYLKEGKEEPGRHKVVFHTARRLCELGVERDEARRAIHQANKKHGKSQELSASEIEHGLDTAYNGGS